MTDEREVRVGQFVWKYHESVGWYDADEDDPAMDTEIALLEEIERLRVAVAIAAGMLSTQPGFKTWHPEHIMKMIMHETNETLSGPRTHTTWEEIKRAHGA